MNQGPIKLAALVLTDLMAFACATGAAMLACPGQDSHATLDAIVAAAAFLAASALLGLYRNTWPRTKPELDSVRELRAQVMATALTLLSSLAFQEVTDLPQAICYQVKGIAAVCLVPCLVLFRHLLRTAFHIPKNTPVRHGEITVPHEETTAFGLFLPVSRALKHFIEISLAASMLILFMPAFAVIALLVKLTSAGPALYFSERIGRNGKTFRLVKFRTMTEQAEAQLKALKERSPNLAEQWDRQFKLEQDPRITPLGKILRKTSLDELPQLWNVIAGHMAIIGPRPIVRDEIRKYGKHFPTLVSVKPGITGLWQVSGRNDLTYEQRVAIDCFYVQHWSPWLDLYIILKTITEVIRAHGR